MDHDRFWGIVQAAHDRSLGAMDRKCAIVRASVAALSKTDAAAFAALFAHYLHRAYDHKLWGAAYVINGGCSDDCFYDFRSALISRGRRAYERALADPDGLAAERIDENAWFYEGFQYAVREGAEVAFGGALPRGEPHPLHPTGERWDEDKVYDLYPRLKRRFAWRMFVIWLFGR